MAFRHGVYIQESPTPLTPPAQVDSAMPVAFGVAPVHKLENPEAAVNVPLLIYNLAEGVENLGYSDAWDRFTLSEMLYSQFSVHNVAPVVMVNVWDPTKSAAPATSLQLPVINGVATLEDDMAMMSTVEVLDASTATPYERGLDYELAYDGDYLQIRVIKGGAITDTAVDVTYQAATLDVTANDIIGGVDSTTLARKGIELADEVFLCFEKNPGFLLAPGWSDKPEVAAALIGKAKRLNGGNFSCIALLDLPADAAHARYTDMPEWKNKNGYNDPYAFAQWPCVAIGERVFHASTRIAGMYGVIDDERGGRPYVSASNKVLSMTRLCTDDGSEIRMLDQGQANFLNENGIGTFLNWGGWRAWGNETSAYPGTLDVKDAERSVRRMFSWISNTIVRTVWPKIDFPINRILIDGILLTINQWFNTLKAEGAINGGRVEFLEADNNESSLMSGRLFFRVYMCPPGAAKDITFDLQYDPAYLKGLFN